jgi:hypothetical protein
VNGQSVEIRQMGTYLIYIVLDTNDGPYELFGLDQSTIRLGLEYGINNRLQLERQKFGKNL